MYSEAWFFSDALALSMVFFPSSFFSFPFIVGGQCSKISKVLTIHLILPIAISPSLFTFELFPVHFDHWVRLRVKNDQMPDNKKKREYSAVS